VVHQAIHDMRQSRIRFISDPGCDRIDRPVIGEIVDFGMFSHLVSFVINVPGVVSR